MGTQKVIIILSYTKQLFKAGLRSVQKSSCLFYDAGHMIFM